MKFRVEDEQLEIRSCNIYCFDDEDDDDDDDDDDDYESFHAEEEC